MLNIETRMDPVEIEGEAIKGLPKHEDQVIVMAHWNYHDRVVVEFRGVTFTVSEEDLTRAIQNAVNHS